MNSRALKRWDIDSNRRVAELKAFALQYPEWKAALEAMTELSAVDLDGMPRGTSVGDPVGQMVESREVYVTKMHMVDYSIRFCSSDPSTQKAVLMAVTTPGVTYQWLKSQGLLFCGRNVYYESVHKFFYMLDRIKI